MLFLLDARRKVTKKMVEKHRQKADMAREYLFAFLPTNFFVVVNVVFG